MSPPIHRPSSRAPIAPRYSQQRSVVLLTVCAAGTLAAMIPPAIAQQAMTLNGPPVQVKPYVSEPGVPEIKVLPGTLNPFPGSSLPSSPSSPGSGDGTGTPSDGTSTQDDPSNPVLGKMLATPFGGAAINAAAQLGVSATALAGTCVMESGCSTNPASHGTISGTFQMKDSTYLQMASEIRQRDPELGATIPAGLGGKNDPAVQALAASQYLYDGARALQSAGIATPTFTDTRSYFQFGPTSGIALASASTDQLVSSVVSLTPAQYAANGINPAATTIGQWRQTISNKLGAGVASTPVLTGT